MQGNGPYFPNYLYGDHLVHPVYNIPLADSYRNNLTLQPNIVGEGDVTTVLYCDGTYQFFFTPVSRSCNNSSLYNNSCPCCMNYMNSINNTWFIRSISNPISPATFSQQLQNLCGRFPSSKAQTGGYILHNGYQMKFHNNDATSTTDLEYFYPSLRPITCCSIQADAITETNISRKCSKPCCSVNYCSKPCCSKNQQYDTLKSQSSTMSFESQKKKSKKMTRIKKRRCKCTKDHAILLNDDSYDTLCGWQSHIQIPPKTVTRKHATLCPCQSSNSIDNDSET